MCGLTRHEEIDYVNFLLPDYVGFVFAPSKRQVSVNQAAELAEHMVPAIKKVGVFVNAHLSAVVETAERVGLDVIQLHGDESSEYCRALANRGFVLWKAIGVETQSSLAAIGEFPVDGYLFDTYDSRGSRGGTGHLFDWRLVAGVDRTKTIILAGGLSPANVTKAIRTVRPDVIDVSSGVEVSGRKNFFKMKEFIEKARRDYEFRPIAVARPV